MDEQNRGFTAAVLLPSDQGLLCVTADQQFLFYSLEKTMKDELSLTINRRLIGYNEEIVDMRFLGDDEQFLAVATNVEHVNCSSFLSISFVCYYFDPRDSKILVCYGGALTKQRVHPISI